MTHHKLDDDIAPLCAGDLLSAPWYRPLDAAFTRLVLVIEVNREADYWQCYWVDDGAVTFQRFRDFHSSDFVLVSGA